MIFDRGPWNVGPGLLVAVATLLIAVACAHIWNVPLACRVAADEDQIDASRRGFVFVGGSAAAFLGTDIAMSAGMFLARDGRKELHLIAPTDVANLLSAHGFTRTGTECQTSDGQNMEILVRAFEASAPAPNGDPT